MFKKGSFKLMSLGHFLGCSGFFGTSLGVKLGKQHSLSDYTKRLLGSGPKCLPTVYGKRCSHRKDDFVQCGKLCSTYYRIALCDSWFSFVSQSVALADRSSLHHRTRNSVKATLGLCGRCGCGGGGGGGMWQFWNFGHVSHKASVWYSEMKKMSRCVCVWRRE